MCLYPKRYINKKYTATEKNGGDIPSLPVIGVNNDGTPIYDERITHIQIPCGQCKECRQAKAREWQQRLSEEYKTTPYNYFITLTFAPKELQKILFKTGQKECNAVAAYALRHCLERYRKDYKKSLKHWFITELGHEGTERIHMHGLILSNTKLDFDLLERVGQGYMAKWKYWKYGHIFVGDYVNMQSINYVVKYMEKIDTDHKGFIGQVLCSPGIGRSFVEKEWVQNAYKYRPRDTRGYYSLPNGSKVKLSTYYKNKLLNEEEREKVWREFLDQDKTSIAGLNLHHGEQRHLGNIIAKQQEINNFLGYGTDSKEWRKRPHNITKRMLQQEERNKRMQEMAAAIRTNNYEIAKKLQKND